MPPKKNVGGSKGKGRAKSAPKRPLPYAASSSDDESPQGLQIVLKRLAALEKDNTMLKQQLKASQTPAGSKSKRIANRASFTESEQLEPRIPEQRNRPAPIPLASEGPASQPAPLVSTPARPLASEISPPAQSES